MASLQLNISFVNSSLSDGVFTNFPTSCSSGLFSFNCMRPYLYALQIASICIALYFYLGRKPSIYLLDYSCAKLSDRDKTGLEMMLFFLKGMGTVDHKDIRFQNKVFLKSGVGEEAYVPRALFEKGHNVTLQDSYDQAFALIVKSVEAVLKKTGTAPSEIDIVVVNSGMFNPTPSLAALLVSHFKMRQDVRSFHLAGMGCSAGLISVDLAKDLLRVHRDARYALVASAEVMQLVYDGRERSMMVTNCLFRSAGNALLLSSRKSDRRRAKMELMHVVRVNMAAQDDAYNAVVVKEDKDGLWGADLSPLLVQVAGGALTKNIERLAPKVLPLRELCRAGWSKVQREVLKRAGVKAYVPDFKLAFDHFCIHPGGKAVIDGMGKGLKLSPQDTEPSLMALHRFGNTSASGVWYILAYMEAKQRLKKGEKVWQIGLGSGFKCTTAVWKMVRTLEYKEEIHVDDPWQECIHRYPVLESLLSLPHITSTVQLFERTGKTES